MERPQLKQKWKSMLHTTKIAAIYQIRCTVLPSAAVIPATLPQQRFPLATFS
jgi:hypothetical protein